MYCSSVFHISFLYFIKKKIVFLLSFVEVLYDLLYCIIIIISFNSYTYIHIYIKMKDKYHQMMF